MKGGMAGRIADAFLTSKLTPLLLAAALALGLYAVFTIPSEEDPQISVPLADIYVGMPGASPAEVDQRLLVPLQGVLSGIEGVKYVYTHAQEGMGLATVRFQVGRDLQRSQVKVFAELARNADHMPPGSSPPLIKTVTIDDVPFFTLSMSGPGYTPYQLRTLAEELRPRLQTVANVRDVSISGGQPREIRVTLDPARLAANGLDPAGVVDRIRMANVQVDAGDFSAGDRVVHVKAGPFLGSAEDVKNVVLDVRHGRLVQVGDVATVTDGPAEITDYAFDAERGAPPEPVVTLAVSKRPGADATQVGRALEHKVDELRGRVIPDAVQARVTRNYGETARDKVNTLKLHLLLAIGAVGLVVLLSMGWRSALVVMTAVPITFALTLLVYKLFGYTLNRVTLFALIFVTGIVVDDSIIIVENIHRHFAMRDRPLRAAARAAVDEVGNPTILATLTVIAAVLPMLFVSGLMGPYMSPMPIGASLAMIFSLMVALVGAPWLAYRLLGHEASADGHDAVPGGTGSPGSAGPAEAVRGTRMYALYRRVMDPLLASRRRIVIMLAGVAVLLVGAAGLFLVRVVPVKMLPFDDKNEMQVIVDMPEGTTLETTTALADQLQRITMTLPEVEDVQTYAGTAAPFNFNGLIRHYYLRRGPTVADLQVNLIDKSKRGAQSHDVALRLRPLVDSVARASGTGARVKVVEVPPGPPVLSTLVAEVYGEDPAQQVAVARRVRALFEEHPSVVDVDWSLRAPQREIRFDVDGEKAVLSGVARASVARDLRIALSGEQATRISAPESRDPVPVQVQVRESARSGLDRLRSLHIASRGGSLVPLGEVVRTHETTTPQVIDRKNGERVVYVTADVAGAEESPVYAILDLQDKIGQIRLPSGAHLGQLYTREPRNVEQPVLKWDGEWQITYEVFRDLGVAFAGALVLIYLLIVGWFGSVTTPLVMMAAIPLTLIGIAPGHVLFGAFFTATSMIGMIALAGIMVRNGILLIDYLEARTDAGVPLREAILEAGAVRTRPIVLTAAAVVIGAVVILFDPIFQGLAVALIAGAVASTLLSLVVVPGIYYLMRRPAEDGKEAA
jgi:multidrug efflux pump subunit AcrB